jgi:hypothetical protein
MVSILLTLFRLNINEEFYVYSPPPPYLYSMHCNGNSVYTFLFWEQRGLSPNFHIHVSLSDLYVPRISLHISSSGTGRPIVGIYNSLTDNECGNWD